MAVLNVVDAVDNPGPDPLYHHRALVHLSDEMPTLYIALMRLVDTIDKEAARQRIRQLASEFLDQESHRQQDDGDGYERPLHKEGQHH